MEFNEDIIQRIESDFNENSDNATEILMRLSKSAWRMFKNKND